MSRGKKKAGLRWWGDWTVFSVFGGFVIAYFVFIPLEVHPLHWLFSFLGGVVGYGIDIGLPPVMRFVRHSSRRMALKQDRENSKKRRS